MRLKGKICGVKKLHQRGGLARTKRLIKAAYVLWEVKQGIRPYRGGFGQRLEYGTRQG